MLTAQTQYSLHNARSYFAEHLSVGDYYDEGQRVPGHWFGQGAERLELSGRVTADAFLRLCENKHPLTGDTLTQRLNTVRMKDGQTTANRRVFYDFTFSPPKSVSLAALLGGDERVITAHERAVLAALREFEAFAATRVRREGAQHARTTSNFVGARFTHQTSRALDPHLHTHAILFNATWDTVEHRWKAIENQDLLAARKFAENAYYHELARDLIRFGYRLRHRLQGDFEIEGVSPDLCSRFSKRHAQIDEALDRLLADKPELARADVMALRRRLATAERARKQRDLTQSELRTVWHAQTTVEERADLAQLSRKSPLPPAAHSVEEAVEWAEEHLFDRHSVVSEHRIWEEALGRGRGGGFTLADLKAFTSSRGYLRNPERPGEVTLAGVRDRELRIVALARDGVGASHPLVWEPQPFDSRLDTEQRAALNGLLCSTDAVTVFRGGAGTGKSFVLRQVVDQVRQSGRPVIVLAPQRQQVVEMERAGFPNPATVAQFLVRKELAAGGLLVIDEAGQIGGEQMLALLELAADRRARVILSGDTRQHGPVEASDALVAIERHAGVRPIELHRIRRQDPGLARDRKEAAAIREYRKAVEAAAQGNLAASFARLDGMGAVVACRPGEQADLLAMEYLKLAKVGASTVVVSQTWSEVHRVNESIRDGLKRSGQLGAEDRAVLALDRLDLTDAQKRDERFYPPDAVVVFNRKVRDAAPGTTGKLAGILKDAVLVETAGRLVRVPNRVLDRLSVCRQRELAVAKGERLHLKANRQLASGARVTNGELVSVRAVSDQGDIELQDGRVLGREFREFLPGYAVTSYASQGKTVDYVLLSDSTVKPATNAQQWYVSISRGRRGIRIFTPDPVQLRDNILRSGQRALAVDMPVGPAARRRPEPTLWRRLRGPLLRFGSRTVERLRRIAFLRPRSNRPRSTHEHQTTRMLGI